MPPQLPTRKLGKNGPDVIAEGLGLMGLSYAYGAPGSDEVRFKVLDRAYELGQVNWDSADMYNDSEDLVGKWFKRTGKRDEIFLATKFGNKMANGQHIGYDSSPEYVKSACAKSLTRLGIDTIDLYYCHRVDKVTPIEKTVEAMVKLKNEGKIKYLGLSEVSAATFRRASKIHHIAAVQVEYSPFAIDIEQNDLLNACREAGTAIIAYSPLGRGFLTGAYKSRSDFGPTDFRSRAPRFNEENFPKNLLLVEKIEEIASKKGNCTPGQLALAWVMAQGDDFIPIPGTKKIKYLEENLGALKVKLTAEENKAIRQAVEAAEVHGGRYPEGMDAYLYGDTPPLEG